MQSRPLQDPPTSPVLFAPPTGRWDLAELNPPPDATGDAADQARYIQAALVDQEVAEMAAGGDIPEDNLAAVSLGACIPSRHSGCRHLLAWLLWLSGMVGRRSRLVAPQAAGPGTHQRW